MLLFQACEAGSRKLLHVLGQRVELANWRNETHSWGRGFEPPVQASL